MSQEKPKSEEHSQQKINRRRALQSLAVIAGMASLPTLKNNISRIKTPEGTAFEITYLSSDAKKVTEILFSRGELEHQIVDGCVVIFEDMTRARKLLEIDLTQLRNIEVGVDLSIQQLTLIANRFDFTSEKVTLARDLATGRILANQQIRSNAS